MAYESLGIVIATYGDDAGFWFTEMQRAMASVAEQTRLPDEVMVVHITDGSVARARNRGAKALETELVVFLDADDALNETYVEAMLGSEGDVIKPRTVYASKGGSPSFIDPMEPIRGNHIVVGAGVNRERFLDVGGFQEWPIYEDWALWLEMRVDGAEFTEQPDAVYWINDSRAQSRNNQDRTLQIETAERIRDHYRPLLKEVGGLKRSSKP